MKGGLRTKGILKRSYKDLPLITIITIVYNGGKTLEKTILSIIQQSYSNIEYVIIDGGSTDNTIQIIKKHEEKIDFWISEKDEGISDAFNKGISYSNGEIIGILNADDWYENNTLEKVAKIISDCDIVYGNLQLWAGEEKEYLVCANHRRLKKEMCINHPTVFVKRDTYRIFGDYDLTFKYAMDYELFLRFYLKGVKFKYVNCTLANMSLNGISDVNWKKGYKEIARAKIINKLPLLDAKLIYYKSIFKTTCRIYLSYFGFEKFIVFYRSKISRIKKIK